MRKLLVRCSCGQEMQVPRSAFGKSGMCSSCGSTVRIGSDNTRPFGPTPTAGGRGANYGGGRTFNWRRIAGPSEEAKQQFGKAVDLYTSHRYAEALAIFDSLAREFPDNPEIEQARKQCLRAMNRTTLPPPAEPHVAGGKLDESTIRQVLLTKMLHGATDSIQLQAAELAARLLGMLPEHAPKRPGSRADIPVQNGHNNGSESTEQSAEEEMDHHAPEHDERD